MRRLPKRGASRAPVVDIVIAADALGTVHRRCDARAGLRIVCLVPSITELLCDLGLAPAIVGRTGFCIHPAALVKDIAKVGGTKTVNVAKIGRLAPSHLVVNIDENEKPTVDALARFVPHVIVTHPRAPRDNLDLYRLFGEVFACEREAEDLCARFEKSWNLLAAQRGSASWPKRRVLYLIWKDPWMTIARDTYIAAMLAAIGWEQIDVQHAITGGSPRYPAIDLARAVRGADLVLLSSEPYRFDDEHVGAIAAAYDIDARLVDGELLSWYGSRAIAGLDYLGRLADRAA